MRTDLSTASALGLISRLHGDLTSLLLEKGKEFLGKGERESTRNHVALPRHSPVSGELVMGGMGMITRYKEEEEA